MEEFMKVIPLEQTLTSIMGGQDPNEQDYHIIDKNGGHMPDELLERHTSRSGILNHGSHLWAIAETGLTQGGAAALTRCYSDQQLNKSEPLVIKNLRVHAGGSNATQPHFAIYPDNDRTQKQFASASEESATTHREMDKHRTATQSWGGVVALIEIIHPKHSAFGFEQPDENEECYDSEEESGSGEGYYSEKEYECDEDEDEGDHLKDHVANVLAHQHRTHLYVLCIRGDQARIYLFDRSGVLVSEPFSHGRGNNRTLYRFFHRLATMSREELGFDSSAVVAEEAEVCELRKWASGLPSSYLRNKALDALCWDPSSNKTTSEEWPVYKITFQGVRTVYIGRPSIGSPSLFNQAIRWFTAIEKKEAADGGVEYKLCLMKDSWREVDQRPEHEVYARLEKYGIRNTLKCLGGEDVPALNGTWQKTRVHTYLDGLEERGHYRILVDQVCLPLGAFNNFCELAKLMADAIIAHADACKAGIMHRNVSYDNILISVEECADGTEKRTGILVDWDLSIFSEDIGKSRHKSMLVAWYFRPALSQLFPLRPYHGYDEIEAFVHVWQYCVVRFHATSRSKRGATSLERFVQDTWEEALSHPDGYSTGGWAKLRHLAHRFTPSVLGNWALRTLMRDLNVFCSQRFKPIWDVFEEYLNIVATNRRGKKTDAEKEMMLLTALNEARPFSDGHNPLLNFFRAWADPSKWEDDDELHAKNPDLFAQFGLVAATN